MSSSSRLRAAQYREAALIREFVAEGLSSGKIAPNEVDGWTLKFEADHSRAARELAATPSAYERSDADLADRQAAVRLGVSVSEMI